MTTEKEIIVVRRGLPSGVIYFPKFLIGKEVEVRFKKELTEEEEIQLKKNELTRKLKELRIERYQKQEDGE